MFSSLKLLGRRLFPLHTHPSRSLVYFIKTDPQLCNELAQAGFRMGKQRILTPKQVQIIESYFF